jgi:hypothetical protein
MPNELLTLAKAVLARRDGAWDKRGHQQKYCPTGLLALGRLKALQIKAITPLSRCPKR